MESQEIRKQIRKTGISARNQLSPKERELLSQQIVDRIIESKTYQTAKTIFLYRAIKGEARLEALEKAVQGTDKILVYPLCLPEHEMAALHPDSEKSWKVGTYGISEPIPEASQVIDPADIDLVLCPCSAFDEDCNRMGMGGGYYDRFLPKCTKAYIAAVAFEVQKTACIPMDSWDQPMDAVYTESSIYIR